MPPAAILAASVAAPIITGAIGKASSGGDTDAANAARQAALEQILGVKVPTVEEQKIALQQQQVAGQLTPEMLGTVTLDPSHMEGVSTDPRLRDAQMKALETMQGLGNTGLSAADRVALMDIRNQAAGDSQAAQASIMQNLAQRGMAGGGQELAARMMANQNASNIASQQGMDVAAQAQQNALQALMNSGQLGGQLRTQEFGEKSDVAKAQDAISQFNAANRQNVAGTNVGNKNSAQEFNLRNLQDVMNQNVGLNNQQQMYNKNLIQQQYNNQLNKAQAASGQYGNQAQASDAAAKSTQQMWGGIGQSAGSGLSAYGAYSAMQPKVGVNSAGARVPKPGDADFVGPVK